MSLSDNSSSLLREDIDLELLVELEEQSLDEVRKLRKQARSEIAVPVVLRPANLSSTVPSDNGTTRNIAPEGCLAHFEKPVGVGDVYRLSIEDAGLGLPQVYARSLRCVMLRDDLFEVAFRFLNAIKMDRASTNDHEPKLSD